MADLGSGNEAHQIADDPSEPRAFGIDDLNERILLFLKSVGLLHAFDEGCVDSDLNFGVERARRHGRRFAELLDHVFGQGGGFLGSHSFWRKQNERYQQA
ncbi:MAG: hypothetical protein VXZ99_13820 [Pseudomonadota bacterium]|nr:hypothetical protein [Pseudomonadota bacterium]